MALLPSTATTGELSASLTDEAGWLRLANGKTAAVIAKVERCDARQADVAKMMQPKPWWKFGR